MATKLNVRVNRKRPESMTRQIREQLNDLIEAGELAAGTLLPSERELANTLEGRAQCCSRSLRTTDGRRKAKKRRSQGKIGQIR